MFSIFKNLPRSPAKYKPALGFFWFFLLLFSYYILRPIREQIGSLGGTESLSMLFWFTLLSMFVCVPLFSLLVSHLNRRVLVPVVYSIFFLSLVFFRFRMGSGSEVDQVWFSRALYVFISIYGVFLVSFFWSVITDMFSRQQAGKIFGVIASGGTLGGIAGSQFARVFVEKLGVENLLLAPAVSLGLAVLVYGALERVHFFSENIDGMNLGAATKADKSSKKKKGTGGNPFSGFWEVWQSPFLLQVALYILLMGVCGTAVYFQQAEIVKQHFSVTFSSAGDTNVIKEATTKYFASINLFVSLLTVIFQFIVFKRIYAKIGVAYCMVALPCMYVIGLICLGTIPTIEVLSIVVVLGRSCEYGILNPSKESLYTVVSRSERYKAKNFIDTAVKRSGDSMVGSIYKTLRESIGMPAAAVSLCTIPVAICLVFLGYSLGKKAKLAKPKRSF